MVDSSRCRDTSGAGRRLLLPRHRGCVPCNARYVTVYGESVDPGDPANGIAPECRFRLPDITISQEERAVMARDVMVNLTKCTTIMEVGTPPATGAAETDDPAGTNTYASSPGPASAGIQTEGTFRVWWEDVANLSVSSVKAHMRATYNNTCVSNAAGWGTDNYMGTTGWSQVFLSHSWSYRAVCKAQTDVAAEHKNNTFCSPKTVNTHFPEVFVWVDQNGTIGGGNQFSSYYSHGGVTWLPCPPLQRNAQLTRVY